MEALNQIQLSADLVKGGPGIQVHFVLLKFKNLNYLNLKYLACSDIYFIQL